MQLKNIPYNKKWMYKNDNNELIYVDDSGKERQLIFCGYRGSIAHGMYIPNSDPNSIDDKDIMGIYFSDPSHYIGILKDKETRETWHNEWDCVYYEFLKFVNLLVKGNPNVLSMLWLDEQYILYRSEAWDRLINIRQAFVCKNVYHSFCGYAKGQVHRIKIDDKINNLLNRINKEIKKRGLEK